MTNLLSLIPQKQFVIYALRLCKIAFLFCLYRCGVHMWVCRCMSTWRVGRCVCTRMGGSVCTCGNVYVSQRLMHVSSLITLTLGAVSLGSTWHWPGQLTSLLWASLLCLPSAGNTGQPLYPLPFVWVLGIRVQASRLHSKHLPTELSPKPKMPVFRMKYPLQTNSRITLRILIGLRSILSMFC